VKNGPPSSRWQIAAICAALVTLVFAVFGRTAGYGFVNFDDDVYVYKNPQVLKGLAPDSIRWAFTHIVSSNWHPLTMLSLMLDRQIYGMWTGGYHLTNVLLHAGAAALLFLLLMEMTGAMLPSAFVAAVFAVHPLRAESVAWIAERKDVLSGLLFMLTLLAYLHYTRRTGSVPRYLLLTAALALGLLAKPMLVTVPCLLLLLDYWPLGRLTAWSRLPRLILEKLPLFALALLSGAATMLAQKGAIVPKAVLPLGFRLENAGVAVSIYVGNLVWPTGLAAIYPYPKGGWPLAQVCAAVLLLGSGTLVTCLLGKKHRYLPVGWFWFLGMLAPVIGLLQVGQQAYADRYTYLPEIGLCIALTWALAGYAQKLPALRPALPWAAGAVLCALSLAASTQAAYWRDSITLWTHALCCTDDNCVAQINLATALAQANRLDEAAAHYRDALRIAPDDAAAHEGLATVLFLQGRLDEGMVECREALARNPNLAGLHYNLAIALLRKGQTRDAVRELRETLRLQPDNAGTRSILARILPVNGNSIHAIPAPSTARGA